jgi:RimJ/RimL family protein N-acetyltransferase
MELRLAQLQRDPNLLPWLLRAIGLCKERMMIGHIGFHIYSDPDYLREVAPGGVEFGYTVFAPFRQRAYATEACEAIMTRTSREHAVPRFVMTINPDNLPSLQIARHFRFQKVGRHTDEVDGPEDIFLREVKDAEP